MRGCVLSLLFTLASSIDLCALTVTNNGSHAVSLFDFVEGSVSPWLHLPDLADGAGDSSAGAEYGKYYTVFNTVEKESDFLVADLQANTSKRVRLVMPAPFTNLTRYGIASLNIDPLSKKALALIVGIDVNYVWYCFLGLLNDKTGAVDVVIDLSDNMRSWTYLYDGITAWNPKTGMYYLVAVIGEHDITTVLAFNTTEQGPQQPVFTLPFPDEFSPGMFSALAISPHLKDSLLALMDMEGDQVAIWATTGPTAEMKQNYSSVPRKGEFQRISKAKQALMKAAWKRTTTTKKDQKRGQEPPAPWTEVIQFEPDTLYVDDDTNNLILDEQGNAFLVFHDHHHPVANQIVLQADLIKGKEVSRVSVAGSQRGEAIEFLFHCPP